MKIIVFILFVCLAALFILPACGSARKAVPVKEPLDLSSDLLKLGKASFDEYCHKCHPNGESGLGPALNNKKLVPDFLIRFQVRNGLGKMPSFSSDKLSSEKLDAIIAYLSELEDK